MYRKFIKRLNTVNKYFISANKWLSMAIYIFLMFCLIYQVIARFVLKIPTAWSEEMARYSFIVVMYISCGYTLHYNGHVDMNLIDSWLMKTKNPKKTFWLMEKITMSANLVFIGLFLHMYYPFVMKLKANGKMAATLQIPIWLIMSSIILGFILMGWASLVKLLQPYDEPEE